MIITESTIENPDGSITEMIFVDDENGRGYSMAKSVYDEQLAASEAQVILNDEPTIKPK